MALKFPPIECEQRLPEEFYWNGEWYTWLDWDIKCLHGYRYETASCGCCSYPQDVELYWEQMTDEEQAEVYKILGLEVQE